MESHFIALLPCLNLFSSLISFLLVSFILSLLSQTFQINAWRKWHLWTPQPAKDPFCMTTWLIVTKDFHCLLRHLLHKHRKAHLEGYLKTRTCFRSLSCLERQFLASLRSFTLDPRLTLILVSSQLHMLSRIFRVIINGSLKRCKYLRVSTIAAYSWQYMASHSTYLSCLFTSILENDLYKCLPKSYAS